MTGDHVTLTGDDLLIAKGDALVALARGSLRAAGALRIFEDESETPSWQPFSRHWADFIRECETEIEESARSDLSVEVGWHDYPSVIIPRRLWDAAYVDWDRQWLVYRLDGKLIELSLLSVFPDGPKLAEMDMTTNQAHAKTGRPTEYNWEAILSELVVRADLDGLPKTQAECAAMMLDWCQSRWGDKVPSLTSMKDKLKLIYRHPRKAGK